MTQEFHAAVCAAMEVLNTKHHQENLGNNLQHHKESLHPQGLKQNSPFSRWSISKIALGFAEQCLGVHPKYKIKCPHIKLF